MGSSSMPPGDRPGLLSRSWCKSMAAVVLEKKDSETQKGTCLRAAMM
jgi:hypothetical protein